MNHVVIDYFSTKVSHFQPQDYLVCGIKLKELYVCRNTFCASISETLLVQMKFIHYK